MEAGATSASPKPRGRWLKRLLAVALGFVLLEVGVRVWLTQLASERSYTRYMPLSEVPRSAWMYRGHHYLNYSLTEGYVSRNGKNRHNALGYRGDEIEAEKPAGTYRILVLGGSTVYETGIDDWRESTWVEMQRILRDELGHPEAEVVNAGCGGWTSWENLIDLSQRGLWLDPDLVVVYCGTNDVHARLVPPELYGRDNSGYRIQWMPTNAFWEHSLLLRLIGFKLGLAHKNSVGELSTRFDDDELVRMATLDANPPNFYEDNLRQMAALCRARGADLLFASWAWTAQMDDYSSTPVYQRGFREINAVTQSVAAELEIPFYDHAAEMPPDPKYWSDGRHVNAEGGRIKGRQFASAVAERFLKSQGSGD
jgi:lysophospholipase L1-like esterase